MCSMRLPLTASGKIAKQNSENCSPSIRSEVP